MMMTSIYQLPKWTTFPVFHFTTVLNFGTTSPPLCRLCAMPLNLKQNLKNTSLISWQNARTAIDYIVMPVTAKFSHPRSCFAICLGEPCGVQTEGRACPCLTLPPSAVSADCSKNHPSQQIKKLNIT